MESCEQELARGLLQAVLRRFGLAFSPDETDRLVMELADFLAEGRAIASAVPSSVEPQTILALKGGGDAV